ncbi:type II 3-dehydroquinate dehydratase [Rickettsiales bacterium LUAb2]
MNKILIINGPNLNLLGIRDNNIYGNQSLFDLDQLCKNEGKSLGLDVYCKQTNLEGEIINFIQEANLNKFKGIILNPAAYGHTSIAIMDAIIDSQIPVIEVHISNIYNREDFRKLSYTAKAAKGVISGLGFNSYLAALYAIAKS